MKEIDHIGIVVRNILMSEHYYKKYFLCDETTGIIEDKIQQVCVKFFMDKYGTRYELIEPINDSSPVMSFLKKGGGINHIAYKCTDIIDEITRARQNNCIVVSPPFTAAGHDGKLCAFIVHPAFGIIEFIEHK